MGFDVFLATKRLSSASLLNDEKPECSLKGAHLNEFNQQILIQFEADVSENLFGTFKPTIKKIKIYPGDTALIFYIAHNKTDQPITGISTYHVTPPKVGIYFNKIQCFCFEEQRLKPQETIEMPILFFIDSDFFKDPKMRDVDTITLSYTFYLK